MQHQHLNIKAIPAFQDNYIWLLRATGKVCAVVDPGDAAPVLEVLAANDLDLRYILLTHHHHDHIGGVAALLQHYNAKVFGPRDARIPYPLQVCEQDDLVALPQLCTQFKVMEVPAHTSSHIAYYDDQVLFPGDTLFSVGCGRFFEGSPADMQQSLDKLVTLSATTRIYPAHEYTQSNCAFALQVEPQNTALMARAEEVKQLRAAQMITLPSTLADELATNPFLRTREPGVVESARKIDPQAMPGSSVMAVIRAWKDRF